MLALRSSWNDDDDDFGNFDDGGMSDYRPVTKGGDVDQQPYVGGAEVVALDQDLDDPAWKWCLLTLAGNATIIQLRRHDFVRYLRMNLAGMVGAGYDSVLFNSVSYVPDITVNVSLDWRPGPRADRIVAVLTALAKHNDTVLDLSGEHFNVTR